jgi:REP element-mobilizing transposase RayT
MKTEYSFHATQFFTATIYEWQPVLADDQYKDIIIESLQFLVAEKRIELNAFVIMHNHIHLMWQALNDFTPSAIQATVGASVRLCLFIKVVVDLFNEQKI